MDEQEPTKLLCKTECPGCKQVWSREIWPEMPLGVMALTLCPDCDEGEKVTLIGNSKAWDDIKWQLGDMTDGYPSNRGFDTIHVPTYRVDDK